MDRTLGMAPIRKGILARSSCLGWNSQSSIPGVSRIMGMILCQTIPCSWILFQVLLDEDPSSRAALFQGFWDFQTFPISWSRTRVKSAFIPCEIPVYLPWTWPAFPGKHRAGKSQRAVGKGLRNAENPWKNPWKS